MRILVTKFRHIGDVLLATPLLANLRHHFPDASIDFGLNQSCREILAHNPLVDRLLTYDRERIKGIRNPIGRIRAERAFLRPFLDRRYDLTINLTEGDRGCLIAALTGAPQRLGFRPRNRLMARLPVLHRVGDEHLPTHVVNRDLQFITLLGKPIVHKRVSIYWDAAAEDRVQRLIGDRHREEFVHVHPVSRWMFKCWDEERFAQVIDHIERDLRIPVLITASPEQNEIDKVRGILARCRSRPLDLSGRLGLSELACLTSQARAFLGVDTAPMHMAAAVGTPVVALFGRSEALYWGPWDNDLDQDYSNEPSVQHHGRHVLIQKDHGRIEYRNGEKVSTGMLAIEPAEVIAQLHCVLDR